MYVRVIRNGDNKLMTTKQSGYAVCDDHFDELKQDVHTEITVLESETRTVRGANQNQSLFADTDRSVSEKTDEADT